MQKIITTSLLYFVLIQSFGQTQRKLSTYLFTQFNKTIYDRTLGNNPWGAGFGLQLFFNNKTKFKPAMEFTGDIYLEDDKVFRSTPDGKAPNDLGGMLNLFIGSSFHPTKSIYLSLLAGPGFIDGRALLGIKPSFGFYFSKNQRWTGKVSFINIFNRNKSTREDFGSVSYAIGLRLF